MFRKIIIVLLSVVPVLTYAQFGNMPVKNETQLREDLFELKNEYYNHSFRAALPGDNFLLIDFHKMSYWPDSAFMHTVFETAAQVADGMSDSFKSPLTSKRIDIHMPVKNRPLTVRLNEHTNEANIVMINYDQQLPLKLGMDTIRILKTFAEAGESKHTPQVLYTFLLKDLDDMQSLANDVNAISNTAGAFQTEVRALRKRWSREDTWYHEVDITYNSIENRNTTVNRNEGIVKGFDAAYYLGASVFRNTIAPSLEVGGSYKWPVANGNFMQVGISLTTLAQFERNSESDYNFYNTNFVNIEFGTLVNKTNTLIPLYETSLGIGYMQTDHPSLIPHECMRLFWHYSLSPSMRITPEIFVLFRENQENYVFPGITVSLKIL